MAQRPGRRLVEAFDDCVGRLLWQIRLKEGITPTFDQDRLRHEARISMLIKLYVLWVARTLLMPR